MTKKTKQDLSKRERQIMDVIYQQGRATAAEVQEGMPEAPGYSAVRALLAILEQKGLVRHEEEGPRYVYLPTRSSHQEAKSALKRVLNIFYGGSVEKVVAALVDVSEKIKPEEAARIQELIAAAKKEGR